MSVFCDETREERFCRCCSTRKPVEGAARIHQRNVVVLRGAILLFVYFMKEKGVLVPRSRKAVNTIVQKMFMFDIDRSMAIVVACGRRSRIPCTHGTARKTEFCWLKFIHSKIPKSSCSIISTQATSDNAN